MKASLLNLVLKFTFDLQRGVFGALHGEVGVARLAVDGVCL